MKLISLMVCIFWSHALFSQVAPKSSLEIGDEVPDINFTVLSHKGKKSTINLSKYRGKVVIMDFWTTWCGSCIKSFPKLDSLQKKFKKKIKIILINANGSGDSIQSIMTFYKKWKRKYPKFQLKTSVDDSVALTYFPHRVIPHSILIGKDGKIKAITAPKHITHNTISSMLSGEEINLPLKKDKERKSEY